MSSENTEKKVTDPRDTATPTLVDRAMKLVDWVKSLWPVRAFQRYTQARGGTFAGGIAYSALFSIAAALTVGLTLFSYFLGSNQELSNQVFGAINDALPGVLKETPNSESGNVHPSQLIIENPINLVSIIALLVALWTASSMMTALKNCIRAMFGITKIPQNFAVSKLLDASGFVAIAVGFLAGIGLVSAASTFSEAVFEFLGVEGPFVQVLLQIGSFAVALLVDMGILAYMIRVVAGVNVPKRDLLVGTLIGGIASSLLRVLGTSVVSSVSDNAILAPFAAIITLLLWFNLIARIALLTAAICANPPGPIVVKEENLEHANETPNYVTLSEPRTLEWNFDPVSGTIVADADPDTSDPVPERKGLGAKIDQRRLERARERRDHARLQYEALQAEYDAKAREEYAARSKPSTLGASKDES